MQVSQGEGTPAERSFTGAARRAQIIAATIETIAELGYGQTSFARIAERAGLSSTRLISYHFAGKDELMSAAVADFYHHIGQFMAGRMAGVTCARDALRTYITALVAYIADNRARMRAMMEIFLNFRDEGGASRSYDENEVLGHLQRILRDGQRGGEFRDFDTFVMAATVQRALDGLPFLLEARPDLDLAACAEELVTLFDLATRSGS
ncbi:TetR/AcrR family transcriptional regulator [Streptosporangium amethystogenes subsp. fukuiense]|uniref:TetR/AcrR family transcriptional regulator n=1 Tax=Streptosporangium amethystogenes subsp. fukuiense TaxID=698418 RepID=A0ABW2T673_9ACTN